MSDVLALHVGGFVEVNVARAAFVQNSMMILSGNIDRLPHVSHTWDAILQREVLTLRPPLSLALSSHMRLHNAIMPWTPGSGALRQHRLGNERVVTILGQNEGAKCGGMHCCQYGSMGHCEE